MSAPAGPPASTLPWSSSSSSPPRCAHCGAPVAHGGASAPGARCPRCGWALPAAPRAARAIHLTIGDRRATVAGALGGVVLGFYASVFVAALTLAGEWALLVCPAAGGALGFLTAWAVARWLRGAALARGVRRYMNAVPLRPIGAVEGDGALVRVRGRVHPIKPVRSRGGVECVAWEHRPAVVIGTLELHAEGGIFEIDDGSGVRALVDATHLGVPGGTRVGADRLILAGAEVELVGRARWVTPGEDSTALDSHRVVARRVEIVGVPLDPVLIRQISAPQPPARTRVDPGAGAAGASATGTGQRVRVEASAEHAQRDEAPAVEHASEHARRESR